MASLFSASAQEAPPVAFPLASTDECFDCHFKNPGRSPHERTFEKSRPFCNIETADIWRHKDKHSQSLLLMLTGEGRKLTEKIVGAKLEDVLRFEIVPRDPAAPGTLAIRQVEFAPPPDGPARAAYEGHVATLKQCFACHAPIGERLGEGKPSIENGVSCQACHGAGLAYFTVHQRPEWRLVSAGDKEKLFGLQDVRHPVTRIQLCASCHVGTKRHDWSFTGEPTERFVRHAWYALGHPPLPGLEFATFAAQEPAHWRTLQEKLYRPEAFRYYRPDPDKLDANNYEKFVLPPRGITLADSYLAANRASYSPDPSQDMPRAKDVLISGLGVLATYAELVAALHAPDESVRGPEFSAYDCTACHHELRSDFPTQVRVRRPGLPGRPPPAFWTLALARLGAAQAKTDIQPAIADLEAAFSARPFGDPEEISVAADALARQCWDVAKSLAAQPLDPQAATELLTRLVHPEHDVDRDYHAARQYAWAIREVIKDLAGVPHRDFTQLSDAFAPPPRSSFSPPLVKIFHRTGAQSAIEHEQIRAQIDALFDRGPPAMPGAVNWHMPLRLRLPAGQEQQVIANLPDWLEAIATYEPEEFRASLVPLQMAFPRP